MEKICRFNNVEKLWNKKSIRYLETKWTDGELLNEKWEKEKKEEVEEKTIENDRGWQTCVCVSGLIEVKVFSHYRWQCCSGVSNHLGDELSVCALTIKRMQLCPHEFNAWVNLCKIGFSDDLWVTAECIFRRKEEESIKKRRFWNTHGTMWTRKACSRRRTEDDDDFSECKPCRAKHQVDLSKWFVATFPKWCQKKRNLNFLFFCQPFPLLLLLFGDLSDRLVTMYIAATIDWMSNDIQDFKLKFIWEKFRYSHNSVVTTKTLIVFFYMKESHLAVLIRLIECLEMYRKNKHRANLNLEKSRRWFIGKWSVINNLTTHLHTHERLSGCEYSLQIICNQSKL